MVVELKYCSTVETSIKEPRHFLGSLDRFVSTWFVFYIPACKCHFPLGGKVRAVRCALLSGMHISDACLTRAEISSRWKSRINIYFLGRPSGNSDKMDKSSIPFDLHLVIAMLKAQRSAGSPQPSTFAIMPCQPMQYLQQETL